MKSKDIMYCTVKNGRSSKRKKRVRRFAIICRQRTGPMNEGIRISITWTWKGGRRKRWRRQKNENDWRRLRKKIMIKIIFFGWLKTPFKKRWMTLLKSLIRCFISKEWGQPVSTYNSACMILRQSNKWINLWGSWRNCRRKFNSLRLSSMRGWWTECRTTNHRGRRQHPQSRQPWFVSFSLSSIQPSYPLFFEANPIHPKSYIRWFLFAGLLFLFFKKILSGRLFNVLWIETLLLSVFRGTRRCRN